MLEFILIMWFIIGTINAIGCILDGIERDEIPLKLWWGESRIATTVSLVFGSCLVVVAWPYVIYHDVKLRESQSE